MSEQQREKPRRCDWCGQEFRPAKGTGRKPTYCKRSCRQRAYEARKQREAIIAAVAAAVARTDSSRVETRRPDIPSRDETVRAARGTGPAIPAAWRAPEPKRRRRLLPPPPGVVRGEKPQQLPLE